MSRQVKASVELWSDIGARASDLANAYDDVQTQRALSFIAVVNPRVFAYLRDQLNKCADIPGWRPQPREVPDAPDA